MDSLEAFTAIGIAAAAADGKFSRSESEDLIKHLNAHRVFSEMDEDKKQLMIHSLINKIDDINQKEKVILEAARSLSTKQQEVALAMAVDIFFSDGTYCNKEKEFIKELANTLSIEKNKAETIIETITSLYCPRDIFKTS